MGKKTQTIKYLYSYTFYGTLASVAQLDARLTGDQEVMDFISLGSSNILLWRLIMKYFLKSFSPSHCFKKGSCQFLAKECAQILVT